MASFLRFLANLFHAFGYCVLFFSLYSCECVYAARELASHQLDNQKLSLLTASPCTASTKGLQVAHKNGPYSPLGHENRSPTSREILLHDQFRVRSLNSIYPQGDKLILQEIPNTSTFGVKVGFGTPPLDFTLMFDTGSGPTWIQCQPCSGPNCTESFFNTSKSSTFARTDDCRSPSPCFGVGYLDNSNITGYYGKDTITFSSTAIFSEFVFGCGQAVNMTSTLGSAAGILGFEAGKYSLMYQTYNTFKMFCYCIPSAKGSTGYLWFGDQARQACNNADITVSLVTTGGVRYYVKLVGITINGKRLTSADSNSLSNTILDTGTHIGRLPKSVYDELTSLFQEVMSQLHPNATKADGSDNQECYDTGGLPFINDTFMTLFFDDDFKELKLDSLAFVSPGDSQVCLAFLPSEDGKTTIIGNIQQRNLMIRYDVSGRQVGFRGSGSGCGA